jgi:hypothetical protein
MLTFFLAINARGTSSGGGGSNDGSSDGCGVHAAVGSSGSVGVAVSSVRVCSSRRRRPGARSQWTAGSQRAYGSGQRMQCACNSVQQRQCACNSVQRWRCVCGSRQGQPAARLQWETVMAVANQQHNCNGQQRRQHKGWQDGGKIVMDNGDGDGQLWVQAGVGGRSG